MKDLKVVIYAITNFGDGKVTIVNEFTIEELYNGEYELPNIYKDDVIIKIAIRDEDYDTKEDN